MGGCCLLTGAVREKGSQLANGCWCVHPDALSGRMEGLGGAGHHGVWKDETGNGGSNQ